MILCHQVRCKLPLFSGSCYLKMKSLKALPIKNFCFMKNLLTGAENYLSNFMVALTFACIS